jgi:transketolase
LIIFDQQDAKMPSWPRDALKMAVESSTPLTAAIGQGGGNAVGLAVKR